MSQKFLDMEGGMVDPVKIFLPSSLISMQNFVTVSHTVQLWGTVTACVPPLRGFPLAHFNSSGATE